MPYQNLLNAVVNGVVVELNALILGDTLRFEVKVNDVCEAEYGDFSKAQEYYYGRAHHLEGRAFR
jgi:hypothetical protein